jgi:hypothetical protein
MFAEHIVLSLLDKRARLLGPAFIARFFLPVVNCRPHFAGAIVAQQRS